MAERWIPRSASRASTAARGYPASFFSRENRSSDAQPTMAPSRSTAAVAQWVSLIPRTIIRDDDSSKHRADENPDVLGLADDQREGGGLDQERQSAGGGESRRHGGGPEAPRPRRPVPRVRGRTRPGWRRREEPSPEDRRAGDPARVPDP